MVLNGYQLDKKYKKMFQDLIQRENDINFLLENDTSEANEILKKFTNRPRTRSASACINSWIDYRRSFVEKKINSYQKLRNGFIGSRFIRFCQFTFFTLILWALSFILTCKPDTLLFTNGTYPESYFIMPSSSFHTQGSF